MGLSHPLEKIAVAEGPENGAIPVGGPKVAWVTNVAAPYRRPVWDALSKMVPLDVLLLENDGRLMRLKRRGSDWTVKSLGARRWGVNVLKTIRVARGETEVYLADPVQVAKVTKEAASLLLGGWESPAYWQFLVEGKLRGCRLVGFYESTRSSNRFTRGPIASARSFFFRAMDAVVVPGAAAKDALIAMGVPPRRIVVGFNAVDVAQFERLSRSKRDSAYQPSDGHRFIYVGQLIERKNVDGLILAFKSIRKEGDSLTIVGGGEKCASLMLLVDELGLSESIHFVDSTDNLSVSELMALSNTLVLPSHEEVWGLVVNEALACGLHVVVTSYSGVASSVAHMKGVFISEQPAQGSLARGMELSREHWNGWIAKPEILKHTPSAYAETFRGALLDQTEKPGA